MYHHVSPEPGLVTVSPENFERQMEQVRDAGYTALSADQFLQFLAGTADVPSKALLITFDDGYLDNFVYGFPILQRHGLRAIIFAVTGWISNGEIRPHAGTANSAELLPTPNHKVCKAAIREGRADDVMLRWSEIRHMEKAGVVEVHSHTHTHQRWDQEFSEPRARLAALEQDLYCSRDALRSCLNRASEHLCWPWGYTEPGYSEIASKAGFHAQYTVRKGINVRGSDPQAVSRIVVKDRSDRWILNRLWLFRHSFTGRIYTRLRGNDEPVLPNRDVPAEKAKA
jgi:peptidoglycan/xylan/chitin deacetylase (PgdA/CDA1 family)